MIRYLTYQDRVLTELDGMENCHWISINPPFVEGELEPLARTLDIPLDFLVDSLDIDERSRYEREDNANLILINTPILNEASKDNEALYKTSPIGIILTEDKIITVSGIHNPIIDKFEEGRVKGFNPADKELFTLQLFEQNVVRFLECLKKLNLKRNLIEQELYNSSRNRELQELLRIEKSLVYFVTSLSTNDLLMMKMKRTDLLKIREKEDHFDLFEDVIIDNNQALEMSNVYTNILSGTMEAYASIVSNNMNAFIQRLTIITIILMVPTLVASFYGMNLKHLPFDDSPYAFFILIFVSLMLGVLIIWFFRKVSKS
jgi:magnesium transporter